MARRDVRVVDDDVIVVTAADMRLVAGDAEACSDVTVP
jgi:hypothetical protein